MKWLVIEIVGVVAIACYYGFGWLHNYRRRRADARRDSYPS
jgi:hypothetical protein